MAEAASGRKMRGFTLTSKQYSAITKARKISFSISNMIQEKQQLKMMGVPYKFSPYALVWNGDYYYMVGFSEKH
jgi:hypothetical protein